MESEENLKSQLQNVLVKGTLEYTSSEEECQEKGFEDLIYTLWLN